MKGKRQEARNKTENGSSKRDATRPTHTQMYCRKTSCFVDTLCGPLFSNHFALTSLNSLILFFSPRFCTYFTQHRTARITVETLHHKEETKKRRRRSTNTPHSISLTTREHVLLYGQEAQEAGAEQAEGTAAGAAHGPREFGRHQQARPKCCRVRYGTSSADEKTS